jgi:signal recognition particle subunit SRP54
MPAGAMDDKMIKRQGAIISSMTPYERRHPKILDGKRKRRIAAGSGTRPDEINRLLKMHRQMADMMKMMGKNKGMMQRMAGALGMGGGAMPNAAEIEKMQAELASLDPKALEQLPKDVRDQLAAGKAPAPALPGLGGKAVPRLPGLPGLGGGGPRFTGLPGIPGKKK